MVCRLHAVIILSNPKPITASICDHLVLERLRFWAAICPNKGVHGCQLRESCPTCATSEVNTVT